MRQLCSAESQRRRLNSFRLNFCRRSTAVLAATALLTVVGVAHATTPVTWTGSAGLGYYSIASNWNPGVVPNGDYAVTVGAPSPTILDISPTLTSLDVLAGGSFEVTNGQSLSLTLGRTMTLAGSIVINPQNALATTALNFPAFDVTLTGGGEIVLGSPTATLHNNGAFINLPAGMSIHGQGTIDAVVQNGGTILSNVSGGTITFLKSPGNGGLIEATNGGTIDLQYNNSAGGKFLADNGVIRIGHQIGLFPGAILDTANGGEFDFLGNGDGPTISGSTINGTAVIESGVNVTVQNSFTDNGSIFVGGGSGFTPTGFSSSFDMSFNGTGQIVMESQSASTISNQSFINNNAGHTIRGVGAIACNVLTNQGTIAADLSGGSLNVNGTFSNQPVGTISVSSGATMNVAELSNSGTINVAGTLNATTFPNNYGKLQLGTGGGSGTLTITSGALTLNKTTGPQGTIGSLTGTGVVNADVIVTVNTDATVAPGTSTAAGSLLINGNLTLGAGTHLAIDIGGTTPGTGFDTIVDTSANLFGSLDISLLGAYRPTAADTFVILTSSGANTASFSNVADGQRLTTLDGLGSFLVSDPAGGSTVTLSNFIAAPVPEPTTLTLLAVVPMLLKRRRSV